MMDEPTRKPLATAENAARLGLALTALAPWLWNYYVAANNFGPEMTPEISSSVAVIVTSLLNRVGA